MNYKTFFKGKNVAVVGLGPHGEMIADIKFLLKVGANVSFYDMRSETRLQGYLPILKEAGLVNCLFGTVPAQELATADLIILSPQISKKSLFLKQAQLAGVRIEFSDVLLLKTVPPVTLIGIMGEYGKSMVAYMLYNVLKQSFADIEGQGLYFIDSDLSHGALTHLKKIKAGDVILTCITDDMMGEYSSARLSPHVAVFTSLTKSFDILKPQTYNNFIVASDVVVDAIKSKSDLVTKAKILRTRAHNRALVLQTSELFKVSSELATKVLDEFSGLKAHCELVKRIAGVEFYNDSAAITPGATLAALRTLSIEKNIVLILGGAYTGYDYSTLIKEIPQYVRTVVLLPGSGTLGFRSEIAELSGVEFLRAPTLEEAVIVAYGVSKKGDRVLFSPACEAIGVHISRKERGEKFVKAVRGL